MKSWKALTIAVGVLALCAGPLRAANQIFVTVDGLDCRNTDVRHPQAFTAMSFSFGANMPVDGGIGGGGATTGRATGGDMVVMKNFDVCTPGLLKYLARGTHVRDVVFEWQTTSAGGTPVVFMKITLEEAMVSNINYGAAQEGVSFFWTKMTLDFWPIRADGTLGAKVTVVWDKTTGAVS